jgi:phage gp36-like protein
MSAYCTIDELKAEFSARKDWGVGSAPSDYKIAAIIDEESDRVDSYCRDRYILPFSPVPGRICSLALCLSVARVRDIIWEGADGGDALAKRKHDDAMKELADIQAGRSNLDAPGLGAGEVSPGAPLANLPDDSMFGRGQTF